MNLKLNKIALEDDFILLEIIKDERVDILEDYYKGEYE